MGTDRSAIAAALRALTGWDLAVVALSGLLGLVALAELSRQLLGGGDASAADREISDAMLDHRGEALTDIMRIVTRLGATEIVAIVAGVALVLALRRRGPGAAQGVLVASVAAWLVVLVMKQIVQRERPPLAIRLYDHGTTSYPSGHATYAVAIWGALLWTLCSGGSSRRKAAGAAAGALIAGSVGLSRVYLGAHWASDVVAGWAVGGACLILGILVASMRRP